MRHVGSNVDGIHTTEAGSVQIDQVVETIDNPIEETVRVYLRDIAISAPWEDVVQVAPVHELALVPMKPGDIHCNEGHHGTVDLPRVDVMHEIMNDPNAVQLVPVHRGGEPKHGAVPVSA
jgi:hypothetical protein